MNDNEFLERRNTSLILLFSCIKIKYKMMYKERIEFPYHIICNVLNFSMTEKIYLFRQNVYFFIFFNLNMVKIGLSFFISDVIFPIFVRLIVIVQI